MKAIVLGAGMVGSAMAVDLAKNHQVTVSDISAKALERIRLKDSTINTLELDVKDKTKLSAALSPFDLVICAVPGFMGYETLRTIIECKKNVVDISFFPEDSLTLDKLAKEHGVTAIVDCGVAPGMGNFILGYYNSKMELTDFECLVGGLPQIKKWPYNYKAPFSPVDVIEEYTRPARYVENSNILIKPAMSDVEHVFFKNVGTLETFNSDGLRSIIYTMPHIKNMKEKTMRYPGHIEQMCSLRDAGFFSKEPINVNGTNVIPLEFTSKILFNEWKLGETEPELTVMRITLRGLENGAPKTVIYDLLDYYNEVTQTSSMARTTGYTATAAANLIDNKMFNQKGVFPPELVGHVDGCFDFVVKYLNNRGVVYIKSEE